MKRQWILKAALCAAFLGSTSWPGIGHAFRIGQPAPEFSGGPWINSAPLALKELSGRVVILEFWTYG